MLQLYKRHHKECAEVRRLAALMQSWPSARGIENITVGSCPFPFEGTLVSTGSFAKQR